MLKPNGVKPDQQEPGYDKPGFCCYVVVED
jgi:hypothetical protein